MTTEHAPANKRAFYSAFPQVGASLGYLLSGGIFLFLSSTLSEGQFSSWGWRVPFILSIILVGVGPFIRAQLSETPIFQRVMETRTQAQIPILDMLRSYPRTLALASLAAAIGFSLFYLVTVFSISYGVTNLGLSQMTMLYCAMIATTVMIIGILLFANISDSVGWRNLALLGISFIGLWAFPMFWLIDTRKPVLIAVASSVAMFAWAAVYGPMGAYFSELFGTRVRYSGASLSYALAGVLGGALAPFIAVRLLGATGASWSISLYQFTLALISFTAFLLLSETYRKNLSEIRPKERQFIAKNN
jgi:MFS family permease